VIAPSTGGLRKPAGSTRMPPTAASLDRTYNAFGVKRRNPILKFIYSFEELRE
jgi:hypothetical protein